VTGNRVGLEFNIFTYKKPTYIIKYILITNFNLFQNRQNIDTYVAMLHNGHWSVCTH